MPTLFLCGDVMTGRGVDQIFARRCKPRLYEAGMNSALGYVELAEGASGPIARPVDPSYIWGDALAELERRQPDARIVNLETAITTSEDAWPGKGIHYRMHPANVACLSAARLDCCVLANNHVLDWGRGGLAETLATLRAAGIRTAGAGADEGEASAPAAIERPGVGRVLVFAFALPSSGVPAEWSAARERSGVNFLADLSSRSLDGAARQVRRAKAGGDIVVASIHWGSNWGYAVPREERAFAHALIDIAGVDVIHGHSSHHPKGIEVHHDRPILYGCGDFLNDYEGIPGYEEFRPDLTLMYFPSLDAATGKLRQLALVPVRIRRFRIERASDEASRWLRRTLVREGARLGTAIEAQSDGSLRLSWEATSSATGA